jgi:hypothetical protein
VTLFNCMLQMSFVSRCVNWVSSHRSSPINCLSYLCLECLMGRRLHPIYMTFLSNQVGGRHIIAQFQMKWLLHDDISACRLDVMHPFQI